MHPENVRPLKFFKPILRELIWIPLSTKVLGFPFKELRIAAPLLGLGGHLARPPIRL